MPADVDQLEPVVQQARLTSPDVPQVVSAAEREERAYRGLVRWWAVSVGAAAVILAAAIVGLVTNKPGGLASGLSGFFAAMMACAGAVLCFVRGFISSARTTGRHGTDS